MFNYIPSITVLLVSLIVIVILFVVRLPLILIALIAILLIAVSVNQHFALFATDYELLKSTQSLAGWAPYILIGVVILFALGFLFFLSRSGSRGTAYRQNFLPAAPLGAAFAAPFGALPSPSPNRSPLGNSALVSALNRAI